MISLTSILAACPVCAAGADASTGVAIWPLLLIAPFAIAGAAAIAVIAIRRRAR
jgi:hypothetical protein